MTQDEPKSQKGSLRQVSRAKGNWAWEWRYVDPPTGLYQSRCFSGKEFPIRSEIEAHLRPFVDRLNATEIDYVIVDPTVDDLLDRFIADENLLKIKERKPGERATDKDELAYSTATSYLRGISKRHKKQADLTTGQCFLGVWLAARAVQQDGVHRLMHWSAYRGDPSARLENDRLHAPVP